MKRPQTVRAVPLTVGKRTYKQGKGKDRKHLWGWIRTGGSNLDSWLSLIAVLKNRKKHKPCPLRVVRTEAATTLWYQHAQFSLTTWSLKTVLNNSNEARPP
jgi:hypothetical protein